MDTSRASEEPGGASRETPRKHGTMSVPSDGTRIRILCATSLVDGAHSGATAVRRQCHILRSSRLGQLDFCPYNDPRLRQVRCLLPKTSSRSGLQNRSADPHDRVLANRGGDRDRKRTAEPRKMAQESQPEPVSPMKNHRFRTFRDLRTGAKAAKTLGVADGCSRLFPAVLGTRDRRRTAEGPQRGAKGTAEKPQGRRSAGFAEHRPT